MSIGVPISESDKKFIRDYIEDASDEREKSSRRKECAEAFHVSLPTIAAISAWTKIRTQRLMASEKIPDGNNTSAEAEPSEPTKVSVDSKQSKKSHGAHVEYDNETKKMWREYLKNYIDKHTMPKERGRLKVLCLPGIHCHEIPVYLDLGFKPENIYGYEGGDDKARETFFAEAQKYGINARCNKLEAGLPEEKTEFDIVSLDFTGQVSKKMQEILKSVQYSDRALFCFNIMAKRETVEMQRELLRTYKLSRKKKGTRPIYTLLDTQETVCEAWTDENKSENLQKIRSEGLFFMLMYALRRPDINRGIYVERVQPLYREYVKQHGNDTWGFMKLFNDCLIVAIEVLRVHLEKDDVWLRELNYARGMLLRAVFGLGAFEHLERHQYVSHAGKAAMPFNSEFFTYYYDRERLGLCNRTIDFFLTVVEKRIKEKLNIIPEDDGLHLETTWIQDPYNNGLIGLIGGNDALLAKLTTGRLSRDLCIFSKIVGFDIEQQSWERNIDETRQKIKKE